MNEKQFLDGMCATSDDDILALFAADDVLRRLGFPETAQALRAVAAAAILMTATNRPHTR